MLSLSMPSALSGSSRHSLELGSQHLNWWARLGSNQRPTDYESAALPLSYRPSDGESIRGQIEA